MFFIEIMQCHSGSEVSAEPVDGFSLRSSGDPVEGVILEIFVVKLSVKTSDSRLVCKDKRSSLGYAMPGYLAVHSPTLRYTNSSRIWDLSIGTVFDDVKTGIEEKK